MRFFKTLREKEFVVGRLKKGNILPLIKYTLYRFHLSHYFFIKQKYYRMRVWYAPLAFWLWTHTTKTKLDEMFFLSYLKEGDTVVDCGAHLGTLTLVAAHAVGTTGRVIACEMHPRTYSYLRRNVEQNKYTNVTTLHTAVGEEKKMVAITDEYVSDMNHVTEPARATLNIAMRTLDDIAEPHKHIALLKLDVEGHELQALVGAETMLARTDAVYFECAPRSFARYRYSPKHIESYLKEHGFSCFLMQDDLTLTPMPHGYVPKVKYENILALRDIETYEKRVVV